MRLSGIGIFEILKDTPGVYGARFSGAGYRGCCIGLIDQDVYRVDFCKTDDGAQIVRER
jgi:galactokinase